MLLPFGWPADEHMKYITCALEGYLVDNNREFHLVAVLHSALTIFSVWRHIRVKTQALVCGSLLLCHQTQNQL